MTSAERRVDLDRLADYAAGVLDRAETAEVSQLIATRPDWADAYFAFVAADAQTRAQLREYARSHVEPMPADVIARLDEAFGRSQADSAPARHSTSVPGTVVPIAHGARRRPLKRRLAMLTASAAAVVAVAGGLYVASGSFTAGERGSATGGSAQLDRSEGGGAQPNEVQAPSLDGATAAVLVSSGTDYQRSTLAALAGTLALQQKGDGTSAGSKAPGAGPPQAVVGVPGRLSQLYTAPTLRSCLDAVARAHPGIVRVVDFAFFEGQPALVMLIREGTGAGQNVVVVVGPECGATDADERVSQRVP